jgi:hypothetical protein
VPTYEKAPPKVVKVVEKLSRTYHSPLTEAGVTVDVLFAHATTDDNGDPTGPAIKHHGYEVAGLARIVNLKDRTKGMADAEIVLDGDRWEEWSEETQAALIDHELTHFELSTDKDGHVKRDDLDRPKLRIRKHDRQFGWFDEIVRRHGKASFEHQQAAEFYANHRQLYLFDVSEAA